MSETTEEEMKVSIMYQSLKSAEDHIMPSSNVDAMILKSAEINSSQFKKRSKHLLPLSIAASIVILLTVVSQVSVVTEQTIVGPGELSLHKQPMYILQRSKPATANEMENLMKGLLENGDIEQAQVLLKKLTQRYPDYQLDSSMNDMLK